VPLFTKQRNAVAALLRVAMVTAGLAKSNGSLPSGLWLTSPAGYLPRTGISSGTLRSVIEYGLSLPFLSIYLSIYQQWREGVCHPGQTSALSPPPIISAIDILMVTTMALVWTVTNSTPSWGECNCVMIIPAESVLQYKRQFVRNGQISEFHILAPPNAASCTVPPGATAIYLCT